MGMLDCTLSFLGVPQWRGGSLDPSKELTDKVGNFLTPTYQLYQLSLIGYSLRAVLDRRLLPARTDKVESNLAIFETPEPDMARWRLTKLDSNIAI